MTLSQLLASLLAALEGLRLIAYKDSGGVWTIGFGHTGPDVHEGMTITLEQAIAFMEKDCAKLLAFVTNLPLLEAAAFASFGYNCGMSALITVVSHDNPESLLAYSHDKKGNTLPGLLARRQLECNLIKTSRQINGGT